MINNDTFRGVVHGSTVKLSGLPDILDGMEVDVVIKRRELTAEQRKEKLEELFGSCKDDAAELDAFVEWNANQRKQNRSGE